MSAEGVVSRMAREASDAGLLNQALYTKWKCLGQGGIISISHALCNIYRLMFTLIFLGVFFDIISVMPLDSFHS